jgi:CheY-like chemotaxis protein
MASVCDGAAMIHCKCQITEADLRRRRPHHLIAGGTSPWRLYQIRAVFEAQAAYDGSSGLALARWAAPEITVCDLGLPGGIDGYAVARACRRQPALQRTRVIAISGYSRPEDHAKAKEAGFDWLLSKPITFDTLDALLREMAPVS